MYCLAEMHSPTLRLPWNNTLTTNAEAKDGWSMAALERMCKKKRAAWAKWCHQVRRGWQGGIDAPLTPATAGAAHHATTHASIMLLTRVRLPAVCCATPCQLCLHAGWGARLPGGLL